jgi:hypothetical protein
MFVYIGRQYVNMNAVATVDEGSGGQLRLSLANGKFVTAIRTEEIAAVQGALAQLAYVPKIEPAPEGKAPAKKKVVIE